MSDLKKRKNEENKKWYNDYSGRGWAKVSNNVV